MENEIEKQKKKFIDDGIKEILKKDNLIAAQKEDDKTRLECFILMIEDLERPNMVTAGGIVVLNTFVKTLKTASKNALENLEIVHKF